MTNHFKQNFVTQQAEVHLPDVPLTGTVPDWLNGTLIRCGPGQFEQAHASYKHWFDGLSMPHRYTFRNGRLSFQNRFLQSQAYLKDNATGVLNYRGVFVDPQRTFWDKIKALFINDVTDNCNIQTVHDQGTIVIMTELPHMYQIDPISLQTVAKYEYDHKINATMQTAHPQIYPQRNNLIVNYMLKISLFNYYEVFNVRGRAYQQVSRVPVTSPSYMHSFALTERYVILVEKPLKLPGYGRGVFAPAFGNKPFMENFIWDGSQPTVFQVIDRNSGIVVTQAETDAFFYNFSWMGRPIIQYPQDMIAMQELIWEIKPDLVIETGIAHGGSLIYYASLLELIGEGEVLGIDIDIRSHNKAEIEKHPMFKRI